MIAALDTNFPWVNRHKQLLVRAKEWDANSRNEGFLLHGLELREAIHWLEQAPTIKNQQPTALHEHYIRASEEWEAGEIKRLTDLTEEKERQRLEAERQKREAERQSRVAAARELVAFSTVSLQEDPERSILLAMYNR